MFAIPIPVSTPGKHVVEPLTIATELITADDMPALPEVPGNSVGDD
jgi:hypothetical protein